MKNSTKLKNGIALLYQYTVAVIVVWILIIGGSLGWNIYNGRQSIQAMAKKEALSSIMKDEAFRLWITSRGGVYVPLDKKTPSNPYLKHPERDITTKSGKNLTLMNAAYLFHKVMEEYGRLTGVKCRLTSLKPVNPANTPDEWERKTLLAFQQDPKETFGFADIKGKPYLRLLSPLVTKESCLKCHAYQGYKVGEIRGAVGVSLPMAIYLSAERKTINTQIRSHGIIMLLGLIAIGFVLINSKKRISESIRQEEELEKHKNHLDELVKERTSELQKEITDRKQAEKTLRENEQFMTSLFNSVQDGISVLKPDLTIRHVNETMNKWYKENLPLEGRKCYEVYRNADKPCSPCATLRSLESGTTERNIVPGPPGSSVKWIELFTYPIKKPNSNKITGAIEYVRDITERVQAEKRIAASLKEKEVLLREIHHRVKNNMQVIISLLRMHSRRIDDTCLIQVFDDCRDRINAMSLIHEALYQSNDLARIDFKVYLRKLCRNLSQAYGVSDKGIRVTVDRCKLSLGMDQGIAVGMIICELVSNAFKHAFPPDKKGMVTISMSSRNGKEIELIVQDDGKGLPLEIDILNPPSLGLDLVVATITTELDGSVEVNRDNGTRFIIHFKCK